ncbi:zinc finger protein 32-like [Macrosteles quadrilineatus]|uniref:zinc finger protein 32-like n=1 Tax=Macrosteles quadrilineatus TaxID=74068 RepID=UPI0023E1792E|nr:zinc finger protein 32-like [Macrosteles quadrilineatus]
MSDFRISKDSEGDIFQCLICNKTYRHKRNLIKHVRYECGDQRPFACSFCPFSSKQKAGLKLHVFNRHQNVANIDLIYQCSICSKSYKHKKNLNKHMKYECGNQRPFVCDLCPYSAKQKVHLRAHLFTKHRVTS